MSAAFTVNAERGEFWTLFGPAGFRFEECGGGMAIKTDLWSARLAAPSGAGLLSCVELDGANQDQLEV